MPTQHQIDLTSVSATFVVGKGAEENIVQTIPVHISGGTEAPSERVDRLLPKKRGIRDGERRVDRPSSRTPKNEVCLSSRGPIFVVGDTPDQNVVVPVSVHVPGAIHGRKRITCGLAEKRGIGEAKIGVHRPSLDLAEDQIGLTGVGSPLAIDRGYDDKVLIAVRVHVSGPSDPKSRAITRRLAEEGRIGLGEGDSVRPPTGLPQDQVRLPGALSSIVVLVRADQKIIEPIPIHIPQPGDRADEVIGVFRGVRRVGVQGHVGLCPGLAWERPDEHEENDGSRQKPLSTSPPVPHPTSSALTAAHMPRCLPPCSREYITWVHGRRG